MNIFYHLPSINDYKNRFIQTYNKIVNSKLIQEIQNMYVITDGKDNKFLQQDKINIVSFNTPFVSEYQTLSYLKQFASAHSGYSLYLHCKGVSRSNDPCIQDWVNLLEYFCIEQYEQCIAELNDGHNVVGSNFLNGSIVDEPHFSGNFWWAKNSYINTLPELDPFDRIRCEMWIGKGTNFKPKSLHNSNTNHYFLPYPKTNYTN